MGKCIDLVRQGDAGRGGAVVSIAGCSMMTCQSEPDQQGCVMESSPISDTDDLDSDALAGTSPLTATELQRQQEDQRKRRERLRNPPRLPTPEELIEDARRGWNENVVRTGIIGVSVIGKRLIPEESLALMELGACIVKGERLTDEEFDRLFSVVKEVWQDQRWKPMPIDQVFEITYTGLHQKHMNWETAAFIASQMLNEQIKPDAWRKRVTKWVQETGREPVGQRKRKPKST